MDYICKICGQSIKSNGHFWDEHRQKISDYFNQYEPRQTKDDQKVIFKKDIEDYLSRDFNDLSSRNSWLKAAAPDERKEYLLDILVKRKLKKNWVYAPMQSLVRLSNFPSILYYEKEFGQSWNEICKKIGFKTKYKYKEEKIDWIAPIEVKIDSREQKQWSFPDHIKTEVGCLKFGDYSLIGNEKLVVERKSISDAAGTFSAGYDRFKRELQRAKKAGGYIVVLIDSSYSDFRSIEYLPQTKHIKSSYDYLSKRMRDLYEEFSNFQIVFSSGRKHASLITEFVLKLGNKIKKIDIQYLIDIKKL